ncbi:MAG: carboxypeptidase-like regulatory domain-containing protein, partial [Bacteroidetes bacterium]|nr:carboxypeptidase-like regulatory domain-containing protein [Bacteroidota bacterium]
MSTRFLHQSICCCMLAAALSGAAFCQSGKVSGVITDRDTKEPLVGVNVTLTGTTLGATTDTRGEYFILRVPPDTYTLRIALLGYQVATVRNVKVSIDLTTRINVALEEASVDIGEEVIITAERPV